MDNIGDLFRAIFIGTVVANFLFKTSRAVKAIELCKDCLKLLNHETLIKEEKVVNLFYKNICTLMVKAYCLISDYTSAIQYSRKTLLIRRKCLERVEEGELAVQLVNFYQDKDKKTCERRRGVSFDGKLGDMFRSHSGESYVRAKEARNYRKLGQKCIGCDDFLKAKEYIEKALAIIKEIGDRDDEATCYGDLGTVFLNLGEYDTAKEYLKKAIKIKSEIDDGDGEAVFYGNLGLAFHCLGENVKAKEYLVNALAGSIESGSRHKEAAWYGNLGTVLQSLGEYDKATEYLEKSLAIKKEIGNSEGEAALLTSLGNVCHSRGEYAKAKDYLEKAVASNVENDNEHGKAWGYKNLGHVLESLGDLEKAKFYYEKALGIMEELGDRRGIASSYERLGKLFQYLGEHAKAVEYLQKALAIAKKIGYRNGEASSCGFLGEVFQSLGEYAKATEYLKIALVIRKELGDKQGEAKDLGNLGTVAQSLGDYAKAKQFIEKALVIRYEIGDRPGEATDYVNMANALSLQGEHVKAKGYLEKALQIFIEIGDKLGEAHVCGNLGSTLQTLGEYAEAKNYLEYSLALNKKLGDRGGEAANYGNLGLVSHFLGEYFRAKEYLEKGLEIVEDIRNRRGKAVFLANLGTVFQCTGECGKAEDCFKKSLMIAKEIGNRKVEAMAYINLGNRFQAFGECSEAEFYYEEALTICKRFEYSEEEFICYCNLAWLKLKAGNIEGAFQITEKSIQKSEQLRSYLGNNDQFKLHFSDKHHHLFSLLKMMFLMSRNPFEALCIVELGRARALADLMSNQYTKGKIFVNPLSWVAIANIMKKENSCTGLYISYSSHTIFLSIVRTSGLMSFRAVRNEPEAFSNKYCFNSSQRNCEDRSLLFVNKRHQTAEASQKHGIAKRYEENENAKQNLDLHYQSNRLVEEDEDNQHLQPSRAQYYKMIIDPVVELLKEPEIIVVPDSCLYEVPFAALPDDTGKYLSETYRIRIVPSLTTLKLIQDSPADYHSQTGALIVGDPDVGQVLFKGSLENISRLPFAEKEAKMIGRLLGVQPLLGEHATKQAVLQEIKSVSLIHFAAHGDAERGEIALSPVRTANGVPQEEDYLLTMSEISKVQLRAKLVVLSCCHSANGQVRAEGVVGIARAFLGSGARSVLVALWAIEDKATEQFMSRFYEHLARGESTSECLHEAMKWMRGNGYSEVAQWAPFMLIGDSVSFDFEK